MGIFGTGQAIRRSEDQRFLTGSGRYTDDITLAGQLYLHLFRSPFAHGVITRLHVDEARKSTGVAAILTERDLREAGIRDIAGADFPKSSLTEGKSAIRQPPLELGWPTKVGGLGIPPIEA